MKKIILFFISILVIWSIIQFASRPSTACREFIKNTQKYEKATMALIADSMDMNIVFKTSEEKQIFKERMKKIRSQLNAMNLPEELALFHKKIVNYYGDIEKQVDAGEVGNREQVITFSRSARTNFKGAGEELKKVWLANDCGQRVKELDGWS